MNQLLQQNGGDELDNSSNSDANLNETFSYHGEDTEGGATNDEGDDV